MTTRNLNLHVAIIIFLLDSTALDYCFCLVFSLISRCSFRTVKGLEALSHLHTNKLAWHSFKDAGIRHKAHGSKIKESLLFITIAVARITAFLGFSFFSFFFCNSSLSRSSQYENTYTHIRWHYRRTPSLGNPNLIYNDQLACLAFVPKGCIIFIVLDGKRVSPLLCKVILYLLRL